MAAFDERLEVKLAALTEADQAVAAAQTVFAEAESQLAECTGQAGQIREETIGLVHDHFTHVQDDPLLHLLSAAKVRQPTTTAEDLHVDDFRLFNLRASSNMPVAILGTGDERHESHHGYGVTFGIAAGALTTRKPAEEEADWQITREGVVVELPLRRVSHARYEMNDWQYRGPLLGNEAGSLAVALPNIRAFRMVTDSGGAAIEYLEDGGGVDNLKELQRAVFYGSVAVTSVLRELAARGLPDSAAAAGLAIGIDPSEIIPDLLEPVPLKQSLQNSFLEGLSRVVRNTLGNIVSRREYGQDQFNNALPVAVNNAVREYCEIEEAELAEGLKAGMLEAGREVINSEYYTPTSAHEDEEYKSRSRLNGPEARQLVSELAMEHFGVTVEPRSLLPAA